MEHATVVAIVNTDGSSIPLMASFSHPFAEKRLKLKQLMVDGGRGVWGSSDLRGFQNGSTRTKRLAAAGPDDANKIGVLVCRSSDALASILYNTAKFMATSFPSTFPQHRK